MAHREDIRTGWFRRLLADRTGNTLAIVAAALVPITAMIGSGLDMSRAYMAKSRMQSACDAASLAARRVMKDDELTSNVEETGERFFDFNFPQGTYQTQNFEPTITRPTSGVVRIDASTRIPTTVMRLFGFTTLPLSVSCDASLNFVNTDVVLVLDVTGSMNNPVDGTRKIEALQDAVMALYDELAPVQAQLKTQGLRLRYGIVPYSSTVNVGRLIYAKDASYIRSSTPYQSRVANYGTTASYNSYAPTSVSSWEYYNNSSGAGSSNPTSYTRTTSQCQTWVQSAATNGGGPAPTATTSTSYRGSSSSSGYVASSDWGWSGAPTTTGTNRSCRRWKTVTTTTYDSTPLYSFTNWTYKQVSLDTSNFKKPGETTTLAIDAPTTLATSPGASLDMQQLASASASATKQSVSWNGCIEERDTVNTITPTSGFTIPSGANDLNINLIPNSDATRWRPMLPESVYTRTAGSTSATVTGNTSTSGWIMNNAASSGYYACPAEARRLTEWTREDLDDYMGTLQPIGGTYHDIGMIWGARLISTSGIFADGCEEYNGMPCNRHIIFMTDGAQTAYCNVYSAYGVERNDMRVRGSTQCTSDSYNAATGIPTNTTTQELLARHQQRFNMICNATKNMNTSIWVVAFDTALSTNLTNCATNANQASTIASRDQLIEKFRQIGNQIGALRLTK